MRISDMSKKDFYETVDTIRNIPNSRYENGYWYVPLSCVELLNGLFEDVILWDTDLFTIDTETATLNFGSYSDELIKLPLKHSALPFQIIGTDFLLSVKKGILADEPGLGKTIQSILAAYYLKEKGKANKVLVITPASLKYQYAIDGIKKFTDLTYTIVDGTRKQREKQYQEDTFFHVVNYELAREDFDLSFIQEMKPDVIILDEAHRIKNIDTDTARQIKTIDAQYKWLLTGTPVQNKAEEIFSLFEFIDPKLLGNRWIFQKKYILTANKYGRRNVPIGTNPKTIGELRKKIQPYILKRTTDEVGIQLPDLTITNIYIPLTNAQAACHERIFKEIDQIMEEMKKWDSDEQHPKEGISFGLFNTAIELCDSPELLEMSDSALVSRFRIGSKKSPKLDELYTILSETLENNENSKTVIFTQFERMQRIIVKQLESIGKSVVLNGSMQPYERQAAIDKFKYDDDIKFFVSTDAGNYGLNLQKASLLINFDLPANPAIITQRIGRIRRMDSQHSKIRVINLIAKDSVDEILLGLGQKKSEEASQIVDKSTADKKKTQKLTEQLVRKLIKRGN